MKPKSNITSISPIWVGVALFAGLGAGYLLFSPTNATHEEVHIHDELENTWTCSMHPQIRQDEPGACPICGMDLIPLKDHSTSDPLVLEMTPEAVKLAQIETRYSVVTQTVELLNLYFPFRVRYRLTNGK